MKHEGRLVGTIIIVIIATIVFISAAVAPLDRFAELTVSLRDQCSKSWVYGAVLRVQNRQIYGYFETTFHFTRLERGETMLSVSAPGYVTVEIPLTLKRGANMISDPIYVSGYEIPGLRRFFVTTEIRSGSLVAELRPVDDAERAISNHPCLELRVFARVFEQLSGGYYSIETVSSGATRGDLIYAGALDLGWNGAPEAGFRWNATLSSQTINRTPAEYWVVDYLILVPDQRYISSEEMDSVSRRVLSADIQTTPETLLAELEGRLSWYSATSWNVRGGIY